MAQFLPDEITNDQYIAILCGICGESGLLGLEVVVSRSDGTTSNGVIVPNVVAAWSAVTHTAITSEDGTLIFRNIRVALSDGCKNVPALKIVQLNRQSILERIDEHSSTLSDDVKKAYCESLVHDFGLNMYSRVKAFENGTFFEG